jgi:outer membrane murein-binding lipoprotein Lpp
MRRPAILTAAVLMLIALAGCATLADKSGIATKKFAEDQAAAAVEKANAASKEQLQAEIAQLRTELKAVQQEAAATSAAIEQVNQMVTSVAKMEEMAKSFEQVLPTLPDETLRRLVTILSDYLAKAK